MGIQPSSNSNTFKHTVLATVAACGLAVASPSTASAAEPVTITGIAIGAAVTALSSGFEDRNREIASRQSTGAGRALARQTGISSDAIDEHGVMGGPNSEARKVERAVREAGRSIRRKLRRLF